MCACVRASVWVRVCVRECVYEVACVYQYTTESSACFREILTFVWGGLCVWGGGWGGFLLQEPAAIAGKFCVCVCLYVYVCVCVFSVAAKLCVCVCLFVFMSACRIFPPLLKNILSRYFFAQKTSTFPVFLLTQMRFMYTYLCVLALSTCYTCARLIHTKPCQKLMLNST